MSKKSKLTLLLSIWFCPARVCVGSVYMAPDFKLFTSCVSRKQPSLPCIVQYHTAWTENVAFDRHQCRARTDLMGNVSRGWGSSTAFWRWLSVEWEICWPAWPLTYTGSLDCPYLSSAGGADFLCEVTHAWPSCCSPTSSLTATPFPAIQLFLTVGLAAGLQDFASFPPRHTLEMCCCTRRGPVTRVGFPAPCLTFWWAMLCVSPSLIDGSQNCTGGKVLSKWLMFPRFCNTIYLSLQARSQ